MPRSRSRIGVLWATAVVGATGCSNPTAPGGGPGIHIVAGAGQSDSVQSTLVQALVVRVTPPKGSSGAHQPIQFLSVVSDSGAVNAFVMPLDFPAPTTFVADTTDAKGEASVQIVLGTGEGAAKVIVAVPNFGFVDTVAFTVLPGAGARIAGAPRDTALYVNGTERLRSTVVDRFGNQRPGDDVTYAIASGPATLAGAVVTGTAIGRVTIVGSSNSVRDSTFASVVPQGTLAATTDTSIVMFNLDGSGYVEVARVAATIVKWAPSGKAILFNDATSGSAGGPGGSVYLTDTAGNVSVADQPPPGSFDTWPAYSRDGAWIYFARYPSGAPEVLWRSHPNGTGADTLHVQLVDNNYMPTPSPDGSQVAYVGNGNAGMLRILTLATGAVLDPGIAGFSPQWSPTSDLIAYTAGSSFGGTMAVVHANGTGARGIGSGAATYGLGIDWSPDGQWVVGQRFPSGPIDLINVTSGLVLPLGFTATAGSPTWRPTPASGASPQMAHRVRASGARVIHR